MQAAKVIRTAEKVWFRSGGTSVSSLPFRLGRQSEGHPELGNCLLCLGKGSCRDPQLLLILVVVRTAHGRIRPQFLGALEIGSGSVESGLLTS